MMFPKMMFPIGLKGKETPPNRCGIRRRSNQYLLDLPADSQVFDMCFML
jgi:hypothetical protein